MQCSGIGHFLVHSLLCKVPIQIIGKNFVTSVYGWKNNVNNAKCYKKEFPPDVKGLNFDVYSNYLFYLFQFWPILFPYNKFVIEKRTFENSFVVNTPIYSLHSLNYFAAALAASSGFTTAWPSFSGKKLSKWRTAAVLSSGL